MPDLIAFYQQLPQKIDPVAFSVGQIDIYWYSLMWLAGVFVIWRLLFYLKDQKTADNQFNSKIIDDIVLWGFLGIIIGGRLGYVVFYDLSFFINEPWKIILPFDSNGVWRGISGISFHGGVAGFALSMWFLSKKYHISLLKLTDFIVPAIGIGYFFGRIGNFLNGELYGRATNLPWGMYFGKDDFLRHPSQLYEALTEGLLLFVILWKLRNKFSLGTGIISAVYLIGYATIRFIIEFFRQPDTHLQLYLQLFTQGQVLSLILFIIGVFLLYHHRAHTLTYK